MPIDEIVAAIPLAIEPNVSDAKNVRIATAATVALAEIAANIVAHPPKVARPPAAVKPNNAVRSAASLAINPPKSAPSAKVAKAVRTSRIELVMKFQPANASLTAAAPTTNDAKAAAIAAAA